eukprot:CAMPEP_0172941356 /NCGR_PEP_ID=MMETSP1075-20121228/224501_1 /TAXON_ID=2916 /ORGANISM="Ceratium fusus, Strain PA161109" /LENGTH=148 /DNA_ID=CAMNT_0013802769 /DNA_START=288 /DNA_END=735 /DNA_ORIENTATION=-
MWQQQVEAASVCDDALVGVHVSEEAVSGQLPPLVLSLKKVAVALLDIVRIRNRGSIEALATHLIYEQTLACHFPLLLCCCAAKPAGLEPGSCSAHMQALAIEGADDEDMVLQPSTTVLHTMAGKLFSCTSARMPITKQISQLLLITAR